MKLDVNHVYHQYITRIVIFSLFLFKRQLRQPGVYKQSVLTYVNRRLAWKINLSIDTFKNIVKELCFSLSLSLSLINFFLS